ncbi:MAG TPA: hypothetical protein ENN63_06435 [Bacteroidetes bacterium]|mgnify:CR=1 FL=1|nr:hypothetical protein [Bacteroidota bacterium]
MGSDNFSKDFDLPVPRKIRASAGFADRVMAGIEEENSPAVVHLPLFTRITSIASLVLLCVAMGILIGSHSGFTPHFTKETAKKHTLEQFRDRYHLYCMRNEDLFIMNMIAN